MFTRVFKKAIDKCLTCGDKIDEAHACSGCGKDWAFMFKSDELALMFKGGTSDGSRKAWQARRANAHYRNASAAHMAELPSRPTESENAAIAAAMRRAGRKADIASPDLNTAGLKNPEQGLVGYRKVFALRNKPLPQK